MVEERLIGQGEERHENRGEERKREKDKLEDGTKGRTRQMK